MTLDSVDTLREKLLVAIEAQDAKSLDRLMRKHWNDIVAQFTSWLTVPQAIRHYDAAASKYVHSLLTLAQAFEAAGEPALIERIMGADDANPIVQWQQRLEHAQALSEAGEYGESSRQLDTMLTEMEGASGRAVVSLRARILGRLGFNVLHERDYAAALRFTEMAHSAAVSAGDEEGRVTFYENILSLRVIQALDADPERGQLLLEVRRLIAQAQASADAGRYQASLQTLSDALVAVRDRAADELFHALLPKIHGLLGFNAWKLGDVASAGKMTALALDESRTVGDSEGVRIYSANLQAMKTTSSATAHQQD